MTFDYKLETINFQEKIAAASDERQLEALRIEFLGRKGKVAFLFSNLSTLSKEQKPQEGKKVNDFRALVTRSIDEKKKEIAAKKRQDSKKTLDITIPGVAPQIGHAHILTQTIDEISCLFGQLGFVVQEGPEIETEFNNFTALNIPADHPSRDSFDTFYLKQSDPSDKKANLLLRSHTSPTQIRIMKEYKPPLAVIVPGKVYRPDAVDASHSFMFHQIEGLLVDRSIKFSDLKGLLTIFLKNLFGESIKMRFRPHFFPFTEKNKKTNTIK